VLKMSDFEISTAIEIWNFMIMLLLPIALLILMFYIIAISKAINITLKKKIRVFKGKSR